MSTKIISPRMFSYLKAFYPYNCDIQYCVETQDSTGYPVKTWMKLSGHGLLPCRLSPSGGSEAKTPTQVYSTATHVIELTNPYPSITTKMRAVIESQAYDILAVERDGQTGSSRLVVEVVI